MYVYFKGYFGNYAFKVNAIAKRYSFFLSAKQYLQSD